VNARRAAAILLEDEEYDPKEEIMRLAPDNLMPDAVKKIYGALKRSRKIRALKVIEHKASRWVLEFELDCWFDCGRHTVRRILTRAGLLEPFMGPRLNLTGGGPPMKYQLRIDLAVARADEPYPGGTHI
jgi:hypothetical protein